MLADTPPASDPARRLDPAAVRPPARRFARLPAVPPNQSYAFAAAPPIKRILIATKFRFIGDTLLATPIFRAARAQWPDAHIALLTGKNARVLLQNNPYSRRNTGSSIPYKSDKGTKAYLRLVHRIRSGKFDLSAWRSTARSIRR